MSKLLTRRFIDQIKVMFGKEPAKPAEISPAAQKIHFYKKNNRDEIAELKHRRAHEKPSHKWRNRRWATLIFANLLFVFSYWLDIQVLEGALTASRFVGFHMADLNSALQVMLAHKHIITNLLIWAIPGAIIQFIGGSKRQMGILLATGLLINNPLAGWAVLAGILIRLGYRHFAKDRERAETDMTVMAAGFIAGDALWSFGNSMYRLAIR